MVIQTCSKIYKPPTLDELKMDGERLIVGKVKYSPETRHLLSRVVMATVIVLMFVCLFCMIMFFRQAVVWSNREMEEFKMKVENNSREIQTSKFLKTNNISIFWNFQSGYQTVRTQSIGETICFVFQIDNTSHASFNNGKKPTRTNIFQVRQDITRIDEKSIGIVGIHAFEACKNIRIMWLASYPVDLQVVDTTTDPTGDVDEDGGIQKISHKRDKRNIRSCRTSCCYRVCCCDVHHFMWEVAEEFNCNHVCNKCSKKYRPVIQRIC